MELSGLLINYKIPLRALRLCEKAAQTSVTVTLFCSVPEKILFFNYPI